MRWGSQMPNAEASLDNFDIRIGAPPRPQAQCRRSGPSFDCTSWTSSILPSAFVWLSACIAVVAALRSHRINSGSLVRQSVCFSRGSRSLAPLLPNRHLTALTLRASALATARKQRSPPRARRGSNVAMSSRSTRRGSSWQRPPKKLHRHAVSAVGQPHSILGVMTEPLLATSHRDTLSQSDSSLPRNKVVN
jgi:hypothetical protein